MNLGGITVPVVLVAVACIAGGWLDWRYRRLPNWLCGLTATAGLIWAFMAAPPGAPWYAYLLHGVVALLVGMALFAFGWIGGGDAKYYAGLACWIPFSRAPLLLTSVCLAGFLLLVVWFTVRRLQGKKIAMGKRDEAAKLPFGIAIALGSFLAFTAGN